MKLIRYYSLSGLALISAIALSSCCADVESVTKVDEPLQQMPFEKVTLQDEFWLPRLKTQKQTLVPFSLEKTEPAVENLRRVGAYLKTGEQQPLLPQAHYVASDLFKVMEGAAYLLTLEKDEALERQMDEIIDIIGEAQKEDGYLYELHSVPESMRTNKTSSAGKKPYGYITHSHELYNMGHMYEGAVAYYQATGKRKWLDIAEKSAQHINKVIFEGGDKNYNDGKPIMQAPGHQEIELALVKLYQATDNKLYLDMAKKFLDIRGVDYDGNSSKLNVPNYAQQHLPVREQFKAVGHSVRAMYLYSGMADVAAISGDETLRPALDSLWHDIVDKKMHINGGLGAVPGIEGFGPDYVLPNRDTYDETCAAVGNVFFNYRMFLATGDAKYVDVAEVALYNNVLAGVNIEGNRFFYVNPLQADGKKAFNHGRAGRSPWFGTACCPSNLARLIPQVSGMIYSHTDDDIFCALYAASTTSVPLAAGEVKLQQQTLYPFDGEVKIGVEPAVEGEKFTLWLRIPTWCGDQFVAGELYSYADKSNEKVVAKVNGKRVCVEPIDGYLPICREWSAGDEVSLSMPMPVRYSEADERVEADINRLCITRGPLVYCAEEVDNEHNVITYVVENAAAPTAVEPFADGVMKGITAITIPAKGLDEGANSVDAELKLVPYYSWNNRGDGKKMNVWFATDAQTAMSDIPQPVGNVAELSATHTYAGDDVLAIADGKNPKSSSDRGIARWTSWPELGKKQSVTLKLKKRQPIESVSVYWYDDKGGVQLPESWDLEYELDGKWHKFQLYVTDAYQTQLNQFNMVHPASKIEADALRINMQPKKEAGVGILEVVIE